MELDESTLPATTPFRTAVDHIVLDVVVPGSDETASPMLDTGAWKGYVDAESPLACVILSPVP